MRLDIREGRVIKRVALRGKLDLENVALEKRFVQYIDLHKIMRLSACTSLHDVYALQK